MPFQFTSLFALIFETVCSLERDDIKASKLVEQSFADFKELNESFWVARTYISVGTLLGGQNKIKWSEYYSKRLDLARLTGDRLILADALAEQAESLLYAGQVDKALEILEESDRLYKQLGAESSSINFKLFAEIARDEGDYTKAKFLFKELQERLRLQGEKFFREMCLTNLGHLAMEEGELDEAQEYLEESLLLVKEIGFKPRIAFCLANYGNLFYLQGNIDAFKEKVRESFAFRESFTNSNKAKILSTFLYSMSIYVPETAACIHGAIDHFQEKSGNQLWSIYKHYYDRAGVSLREVLGDEAFKSAFAEGQKMSLDEALDLALKSSEEL